MDKASWNLELSVQGVTQDDMAEILGEITKKVSDAGGVVGGGFSPEVEDEEDGAEVDRKLGFSEFLALYSKKMEEGGHTYSIEGATWAFNDWKTNPDNYGWLFE